MVQRAHATREEAGFIYLTLNDLEEGMCTSDKDAKSALCGKEYTPQLHSFPIERVERADADPRK